MREEVRGLLAHGDVARTVGEALGSDPAALDAIERGILNIRVFARQLIRSNQWRFTEEAVVSALRRYRSDRHYGKTLARAKAILSKALVSLQGGMCAIALPNSMDIHQHLPHLFNRLDTTKGDRIRLSSSDRGFKLIVNEAALPTVEEVFGKDSIFDVKRGLVELSVVVPPEAKATPGILAVITNALAAAKVNLAEVVDGISQHILLVDEHDSLTAYRVLKSLAGSRRDQNREKGPDSS